MQTWLSWHSLACTSAFSSIALVFPQFKTIWPTTKATGTESCSRWCCIRSGFGILARRLWSVLNIWRKIQWLFWFSQWQGPFTSSLSPLNRCYVNKSWYTSLNFQGCILCWAIRNKSEVLAHIKDFEVSSSWRGTIYFKCFLLPWDLRDVFWFLDISGKDS